jgi:hypothetical protein
MDVEEDEDFKLALKLQQEEEERGSAIVQVISKICRKKSKTTKYKGER